MAGAVLAAGCRPKRGTGFAGYAFVANQEGRAVAAVDLTAFAVARHIPLDGQPAAVLGHPRRPAIYALAPAEGVLYEIDADNLTLRRKVRAAGSAVSMRLGEGGAALWLLCGEPRQLLRVPVDTLHADARISLPAEPCDFDLASDGRTAAVSFRQEASLAVIDLGGRRIAHRVRLRQPAGILRYRSDSKHLLAGNAAERLLSVLDVARGLPVTHLPLAVRPENFCFSADGGQLFVTGEGMDAVVIVYPYQTEVAATVLAGHAPGVMAASGSPPYLFVANPLSATVTVFDIAMHRVIAVAPAGAEPGAIVITPDNQYALVLNRRSGDMGVILIPTITAKRTRSAALFTMIPVGSRPVGAAVRAI